jgi:hypothetical protein
VFRKIIPAKEVRTHQIEANQRELGLLDVEQIGFVNLYYYFGAVADRYEIGSKRVDVDAALLKAQWVWPTQPHDSYWGPHITGHIDIAEVPGDHSAMFYPENAPRLAEVLGPLLDRREP